MIKLLSLIYRTLSLLWIKNIRNASSVMACFRSLHFLETEMSSARSARDTKLSLPTDFPTRGYGAS